MALQDDVGQDRNLRVLARWRSTARVLVEALPYILRYDGRAIVVKYGGHAMEGGVSEHFAQDIVLMKQTGPIVYAVALLWLMADLGFRERTRGALRVALGGATALALVVVLMIVLTGSLAVAWSSAIHSYAMPPEGMGYLISCCGGPWWQVGWTVALANPLALSLAAVGIVAPVSFRWSTWRYVALPAAMVLAFLASVSFMPLRQSLRYTSPAHGAF